MEPELPNPHSTVHLTAEIHLLATEEGGRQGPLISGEWRTVLEVNGEHWSARLTFVGQPSPGESFLANVEFLFPHAAVHFLPGAQFTVWEGGTKATGRVLTNNL